MGCLHIFYTVGGVNVVTGLPASSLQTTVSVLSMSKRLLCILENTDYGGEPRARCESVWHCGALNVAVILTYASIFISDYPYKIYRGASE
jgi:hypothetical protein